MLDQNISIELYSRAFLEKGFLKLLKLALALNFDLPDLAILSS